MSKTIAIIPARGGSKRLPRKNILPLAGKPLFLHSADYARSCSLIHEVYVSTDDLEIKKLSVEYGLKVIDRPAELSDDNATSLSVVIHAVESLKDIDLERIVLLQPTNPLRPKGLLEDALDVFSKNKCDSLFTVSRSFQKLGKIDSGKFLPVNYAYGQRSQDIPPLYFENGLLYITSVNLISQKVLLSEDAYPYIVDHQFAQVDIDELDDFLFAQYLIENSKL